MQQAIPSRLCIVSNRLPVTVQHHSNTDFTLERSSGGLATALAQAHAEYDSTWIGWPGEAVRSGVARQRLERQLLQEYRCVPVFLSARDVQHYYDGFSNGALWPLFHCFQGRVSYADEEWQAYVQVNQQFCDAIVRQGCGEALIWVHDYHLLLLPAMLREHYPEARIGFFLHTPFPPSDLFRILPCREALLQGLLGADLVGFHTFAYMQNFLWSVYRVLGLQAEAGTMLYNGRRVTSGIYPISIDPSQFRTALQSDVETATALRQLNESLGERKLLLGMDRLDYSKGIPNRLEAYKRFLSEHPEWRERVSMVQVAVPSRQKVAEYQALRHQVEALVGEINGTYGTTTWSPVQYVHRNLQFPEICALLRRADVALVTPLRDGMNLVAKEYAVCQQERAGALILSEFAGAAAEMGEAFFVNPYSTAQVASRLHEVLSLPEEFLGERMQVLHTRICTHTVRDWAENFLTALAAVQAQQTTRQLTPAVRQQLCTAYVQAERRVLLLDYDGTLTPLVEYRHRAVPSQELLHALQALQRNPRNVVAVISGRDRFTLERWLGSSGCLLGAEHGAWMRADPTSPWRQMQPELQADWKATVRPLLDQVVARTPGSLVEEKDYALVWHYRLADPEFGLWQARELYSQLQSLLVGTGLRVQSGHKVVEIKWAELHKGKIATQILADAAPADFVLAIGDDQTDEDLFATLPAEQWAIKVGTGNSAARFTLPSPAAVLTLLRDLAAAAVAPCPVTR